jgi:hypothetical protein
MNMLKNIALSAEEEIIRKAREKAQHEHTTLNATFRQWLRRYVSTGTNKSDFKALMEKLSYAQPGRSFTRDEMNER